MTTAELLNQIKNVFANDTAILSWCQDNFGKQHTVCLDIDERHPPDPDVDYPVIVVTSIRQARGDSVRELTWDLEIGAGVKQENIETEGNTKVFTGFLQAETLRELAENALYKARIADISTNSETGAISFYPLFISGALIPIKQLKTNRRGMPG